MAFRIDEWTRYEADGTPIYVRGERPDWFVPNDAGDRILQGLAARVSGSLDMDAWRFLARLPEESCGLSYGGRAGCLSLDHLREVWFHVTNRCNQACRHCLFACSPVTAEELSLVRIQYLAGQAHALGCRVFALTGGEPMVHPDFDTIVEDLLSRGASHVVVLTNGTLLREHKRGLKRWPHDRFHLQISMDGLGKRHDHIRGRGAFDTLTENLAWLKNLGTPFTLSMCVNAENVRDMPDVVDFAAGIGASNVHFMWYFVRGRGSKERFATPEEIFPRLVKAADRAEKAGITIDNLTALRSQVFAPGGTIHDGAGSGWESVAVGPDDRLYPSPALVGVNALATGIGPDLARAWRESPVLEDVRQATASRISSPLRFILGGGDPDHSYMHGGSFVGQDPYIPLHERTALWLIAREAARQPASGPPRLRLRMGDILESCGAHGGVALTHTNCLLAAATPDSRTVVKDFYQAASETTQEDILNPVCYPDETVSHIPPEFRFRGYGCGSPVLDAGLVPGERVLDLGCGTGVECFIASRLVGEKGEVIGVDMLEPMLQRAHKGAREVAACLGYGNLDFRRGYLEDLPVSDAYVDAVLSNCVINLSANKRLTFSEIFRVLRPGGRLVISDVVCEIEPDPAIRNDDVLRGQCIAGALSQRDLFGLLDETGFTCFRVLKRFPYRVIQGHPFFSMTYRAERPNPSRTARVMYRGPFAAVATGTGEILPVGVTREIVLDPGLADAHDLFVFDGSGAVTNVEMAPPSCCSPDRGPSASCCAQSPALAEGACCQGSGTGADRASLQVEPGPMSLLSLRHTSGCMVCGAPLRYLPEESIHVCSFCGAELPANAVCEKGHFVCDTCHSRDAAVFIAHALRTTRETDMVALLDAIRRHPSIPMHGPEHHILVPGLILATYRNLGGHVTEGMLETALRRGGSVPGGNCAFTGACGAAIGVGIAFGLLLGANPVKAHERRQVQEICQSVIGEQACFAAARCCQRDSWIALRKAAEWSRRLLPVTLKADYPLRCRQSAKNRECIRTACPLWKRN